eukprot:7384905-Prymnesium_polylepis.2
MQWEALHCNTCDKERKLVRFVGRPDELTAKVSAGKGRALVGRSVCGGVCVRAADGVRIPACVSCPRARLLLLLRVATPPPAPKLAPAPAPTAASISLLGCAAHAPHTLFGRRACPHARLLPRMCRARRQA